MPILSIGKSASSRHAPAAGFTLLELLVVLAIIGLGAAWVLPQLGNREVALLKSETRRAVSVLNHARRSALIQGRTVEAVFYPPRESLAPGASQGESAPPAGKNDELHWISRGPALQWKAAGDLESAPPAADKPGILFTFYPEGGGSGGELILQQAAYRARISVHPLTGKVATEIGDAR
jgi:general secretion pathway protein H